MPPAPPRKRRPLRRLAIFLSILGALAILARITSLAEALTFYFPSRESFTTPRGVEDITFTNPDGLSLHAWFMPALDAAPGEKRPLILHCHGNAGNISSHAEFSRFLTEHGFHVLIFDYRSFGRSSPATLPSRRDFAKDALAAFDYAVTRPDVDASRIGVYGVSMGGAFALHVAAERPTVRSACTVAAFSSFNAVAADHSILGRILIPNGLAPRDSAAKLAQRPYLIVHGSRDSIVFPKHADALLAAAKSAGVPAERVIIDGADHNDIADFAETRDAIANFFTRTFASN